MLHVAVGWTVRNGETTRRNLLELPISPRMTMTRVLAVAFVAALQSPPAFEIELMHQIDMLSSEDASILLPPLHSSVFYPSLTLSRGA